MEQYSDRRSCYLNFSFICSALYLYKDGCGPLEAEADPDLPDRDHEGVFLSEQYSGRRLCYLHFCFICSAMYLDKGGFGPLEAEAGPNLPDRDHGGVPLGLAQVGAHSHLI